MASSSPSQISTHATTFNSIFAHSEVRVKIQWRVRESRPIYMNSNLNVSRLVALLHLNSFRMIYILIHISFTFPLINPLSLSLNSSGKGGFGSMLRAIGAQIEKTTNREACRDLSGRRLRDINEEKRLKAWIEAEKNKEKEDPDEKLKKKIGKLLAVPKKEFNDPVYDASRTNLLDNISSSLEAGLRAKSSQQETASSSSSLKRKSSEDESKPVKRIKGALWIDEGISSGSDTDDSDYEEGESSSSAVACSSRKKWVSSTSNWDNWKEQECYNCLFLSQHFFSISWKIKRHRTRRSETLRKIEIAFWEKKKKLQAFSLGVDKFNTSRFDTEHSSNSQQLLLTLRAHTGFLSSY